jgi:hypothetical protein
MYSLLVHRLQCTCKLHSYRWSFDSCIVLFEQGEAVRCAAHFVTHLKMVQNDKHAIKNFDRLLPEHIQDLSLAAALESTLPNKCAVRSFLPPLRLYKPKIVQVCRPVLHNVVLVKVQAGACCNNCTGMDLLYQHTVHVRSSIHYNTLHSTPLYYMYAHAVHVRLHVFVNSSVDLGWHTGLRQGACMSSYSYMCG